MSKVVFCCDCAARAPMADTSYTVIGSGWRVSRRQTPEGIAVEWRCKDCFRKWKGGQPKHPSSDGIEAVAGSPKGKSRPPR
jgi:hypothetical protein